MSICPACGEDPCGQYARCRYPYTHHGPAVHDSKMMDYLISEQSLKEDERAAEKPAQRREADIPTSKDLDKRRAETLAEISRVAAELRDETDEGRRKALEKRLEELEGVESDLLDRRVSTLRGDL